MNIIEDCRDRSSNNDLGKAFLLVIDIVVQQGVNWTGMDSLNFKFIETHEPVLFKLAAFAEAFFRTDPNTTLLKTRQFGEALSQQVAAHSNREPPFQETQVDRLNRLHREGLLPRSISDMLHFIRKRGNEANHDLAGSQNDALTCLKFTLKVSSWYVRAFLDPQMATPSQFIPPPLPKDATPELLSQIEEIKNALSDAERQQAEKAARLEQTEAEKQKLQAAAEAKDGELAELKRKLGELRKESAKDDAPSQSQLEAAAESASRDVELTEDETRNLIDSALQDADWEVDHITLTQAKGARPEKGKNRAISEWQTASGPVDYALFIGETCVGVIEAKRESKDVPGVLQQAERYAKDLQLGADELVPGAPFSTATDKSDETFKVPFAFATNGRPHVKQFKNKSGIWYRDLRSPNNHAKDLPEWFSPKDLIAKLEQETDKSAEALAKEPFSYTNLRYYQQDAVRAVEQAIEEGADNALVSMATGTGKTRTAIALMYRLLKHKRFRRILFLVDRNALADQTLDSLENAEFEQLLNFTDTYGVMGPTDKTPDKETRVHVATVQSLVARIFNSGDDKPTPGMYDLIIVDEAHRGYALDAELLESDIEFRSTTDYLSKYRRVIEYFDAVRVGLTATPALQTTEIFGPPVYRYSYRQAVIDGFLTDHLPPRRILTALNTAGIKFEGGEEVSILDPETGVIDTEELPDELEFEVATFNTRVYTEEFNRVVAETIAREIPPEEPGKTLIFAARDDHADLLVTKLREALRDEYGDIPNDMVVKITGSVDRPRDQIRRFRNDARPKYVVTVDLLTTGVDIPKICNLVFVRRVNSRILYDQMIGRATRLCDEINKTEFKIYDAVDLYDNLQSVTEMRPVVTKANLSFGDLVRDLEAAPDDEARGRVQEQIVAKMRRRLKRLRKSQAEKIETATGDPASDLADTVQALNPSEAVDFFSSHSQVVAALDGQPAKRPKPGVPISEHDDEVLDIVEVFKDGLTPEDYIEAFERYVRANMNGAAAMIAVTQKPGELTRADLKALARDLDKNDFSYASLRAAYGRVRNADIAAHIAGFVRQAAIGDPLVPYPQRVERAIKQMETSRDWTANQRDWLRRIGRALKQDVPVADKQTFEAPYFRQKGGWRRIDQEFGGNLEKVVQEINAAIWTTPQAG